MEIDYGPSYAKLGIQFQYQWSTLLRDALKKHGITDAQAKAICGDFAFDLSKLIDEAEIKADGLSYRPVIAFTEDEEILLVQSAEFDYHEAAYATAAAAFEKK